MLLNPLKHHHKYGQYETDLARPRGIGRETQQLNQGTSQNNLYIKHKLSTTCETIRITLIS